MERNSSLTDELRIVVEQSPQHAAHSEPQTGGEVV